MTPDELQRALDELAAYADARTYPAEREPDAVIPQLYNVATDRPYGDNRSDHHDRDRVYLAWLTQAELEKIKADSKGRLSYWPAGWYPSGEAMIADDEDFSIWEKGHMTDDEWHERFHSLETEDGSVTLISDTNDSPAVLKLLTIADPHYIWSQYSSGDRSYTLKPGYHRNAEGWYVCDKPWDDPDLMVQDELD